MPNTPLEVDERHFETEFNVPVCACRVRALADFVAQDGSLVSYSCLVDSGAPLCVVPYSLWHDRGLQWQLLGSTLKRNGVVVPDALKWKDVDCSLGAARIYLVDPATQAQAGPFLLVGKFANGPQQTPEL